MIRITEGKYYRTQNGRKIGPARPYPFDDPDICAWAIPNSAGDLYYSNDGKTVSNMDDWRIVAEWKDPEALTRDEERAIELLREWLAVRGTPTGQDLFEQALETLRLPEEALT